MLLQYAMIATEGKTLHIISGGCSALGKDIREKRGFHGFTGTITHQSKANLMPHPKGFTTISCNKKADCGTLAQGRLLNLYTSMIIYHKS